MRQDDPKLTELAATVFAMAEDLDGAALHGPLPFTGDELRAYFRLQVRTVGIDAALAEAQSRYRDQVATVLRSLDDSRRIVHCEVRP